jgi:CheY-like chemotaxis protein
MHLLVVEDELELAQYLHEGPRENGHVVDLARDDIEGWRLAVGGDCDLVLLDLMLPGVDGFGMLTAIRAAARAAPCAERPAAGDGDPAHALGQEDGAAGREAAGCGSTWAGTCR